MSERAMTILLVLLGFFGFHTLPSGKVYPPGFGPFGPLADRDGDGVRALHDCDDSDPARWLWYCYDDDKDGVGDPDSPMPKVCGSVALHPPDADYHPCPE